MLGRHKVLLVAIEANIGCTSSTLDGCMLPETLGAHALVSLNIRPILVHGERHRTGGAHRLLNIFFGARGALSLTIPTRLGGGSRDHSSVRLRCLGDNVRSCVRGAFRILTVLVVFHMDGVKLTLNTLEVVAFSLKLVVIFILRLLLSWALFLLILPVLATAHILMVHVLNASRSHVVGLPVDSHTSRGGSLLLPWSSRLHLLLVRLRHLHLFLGVVLLAFDAAFLSVAQVLEL